MNKLRVYLWGLVSMSCMWLSSWCERRSIGCSCRMMNAMSKTMPIYKVGTDKSTEPPQP